MTWDRDKAAAGQAEEENGGLREELINHGHMASPGGHSSASRI